MSTVLGGGGAAIGGTILNVAGTTGFAVGDVVIVGNTGITTETVSVTAVTASTITITPALKASYGPGETVVRVGGTLEYKDAELAQDTCAAGRVLRFGKESEPTLTAGGEAFASGSDTGGQARLGRRAPRLLRLPARRLDGRTRRRGLRGAVEQDAQAVQARGRSGHDLAAGMMTMNTSAVLPLEPGTWYYRVRGYDYSLPEGAQAMSWSALQQIVVTRPVFAVVGEDPSEKTGETRTLTSRSAGLSIKLPSSFRQASRTTSAAGGYRPLGRPGSSLRLSAREARGATLFVQTAPDRSTSSHAEWVRKARTSAARAGASRCSQVSLAAGAAVRCSGTKGSQASVVYLLQHRGVTYTLTFAGKPSRRGADAARFSAAARSLRFTR